MILNLTFQYSLKKGCTISLATLVICRRERGGGYINGKFCKYFSTALELRTGAECYEFYDKNTRICQIVVNC